MFLSVAKLPGRSFFRPIPLPGFLPDGSALSSFRLADASSGTLTGLSSLQVLNLFKCLFSSPASLSHLPWRFNCCISAMLSHGTITFLVLHNTWFQLSLDWCQAKAMAGPAAAPPVPQLTYSLRWLVDAPAETAASALAALPYTAVGHRWSLTSGKQRCDLHVSNLLCTDLTAATLPVDTKLTVMYVSFGLWDQGGFIASSASLTTPHHCGACSHGDCFKAVSPLN